jgi:hypothetical protein
MSQVLEYKSTTTSRTSSSSTTSSYELELELEKDFGVEAVEVVSDAIEINEDLLEKNRVYPVMFRGNLYYVWRNKGATEIFQLEGQ